ncbi:MAG: transposase [Elusimicrobia bacterium]|nr:transposase [Elusimicrobiota bacterium]
MPRPPRVHFQGAVFHAMSRGNDGQDIFHGDRDFRAFLRILKQTKDRYPFELYAYCLMTNHFHLLVRVGGYELPRIMHSLLTRYAAHFNGEQSRTGHLFQNRYKAILCLNDPYLLTLVRYIHLNPVRAGLTARPEDWPWSGHSEYLRKSRNDLVDTAFPLSVLSDVPHQALMSYVRFVHDGINDDGGSSQPSLHSEPSSGGEENLSGSKCELPSVGGATLEEIGEAVAQETEVPLEAIRGPSQEHSLAKVRRILVWRALQTGIRPSRIARFLNRSQALVAKYRGALKE